MHEPFIIRILGNQRTTLKQSQEERSPDWLLLCKSCIYEGEAPVSGMNKTQSGAAEIERRKSRVGSIRAQGIEGQRDEQMVGVYGVRVIETTGGE